MSKIEIIQSESDLRRTAQAQLAEDAQLSWRWLAGGGRRVRSVAPLIELRLDGRGLTLQMDFQLMPGARDVERLANQEASYPPLLVAPSLSETLVKRCQERGISCLDLNGRQWIRAKGILVDRHPAEGRRFRAVMPTPDVFQPKSSRLVRALLSQPTRVWSQTELGKRTGLSPGLISRLTRHLVNEGLLTEQNRTLRLTQPKGLLDAWAARDDWGRRTVIRQYSLLELSPETVAQQLVEEFAGDGPLVFTQWFAANLRHPYTVPPVVSAYVETHPVEKVIKALRARPVSDGGTLWLIVPDDDGVFREIQRVGNFTLACDAQIYLDLLRVGLRGPDQAKALREWEGFGTSNS